MLVVRLLHVLFGVLLVIGGDVLGLLDPVHRLGARMPDRDAAFLGELVHDFDQLFAAIFGQRRNRNADDVAVVRRREPEIGRENALLHRLQETFVPGLHREQLGLRRGDTRHLRQRHLVSVRLDAHEIEQRGRRFAGTNGGELPFDGFNRLVHQLLGMFDVVTQRTSGRSGHWTILPTRSPARTLAVAPGWLMLNTTMGSLSALPKPKALAASPAYPSTIPA